jgi:hypothetical protein
MAYQPKSYRKFVATAATAAIVASAVAPAASAASVSDFKDVAPKYQEAVSFLVDNEITQGTTATTFGTNDHVKRGDAAIWLVRTLGLETEGAAASGFSDTGRYDAYVSVLKAEGIISGKTATTFEPNALLTRGEMSKIIANAFGFKSDETVPFNDLGPNFGPYIQALYAFGITDGTSETTYGTSLNIKRGDLAIFLKRAVDTVTAPEIESVEAVNANQISVTFDNGETVVFDLEEALVDGDNTVTFEYEGFEYEVTVSYEAPDEEAPDTEAPVVSVTGLTNNSTVIAAEVTFTVEVIDNVDEVVTPVVMNGETEVSANEDGTYTVVLAEGENTITVAATDAAGNASEVQTFTYTFDASFVKATEAVGTAEESLLEADLEAAQKLVGTLEESDTKVLLEARLVKLQAKLDSIIKKVNDAVGQLALYNALNVDPFVNVNEDYIADYATAIEGVTFETIAVIQEAIDTVNQAILDAELADVREAAQTKVALVVEADFTADTAAEEEAFLDLVSKAQAAIDALPADYVYDAVDEETPLAVVLKTELDEKASLFNDYINYVRPVVTAGNAVAQYKALVASFENVNEDYVGQVYNFTGLTTVADVQFEIDFVNADEAVSAFSVDEETTQAAIDALKALVELIPNTVEDKDGNLVAGPKEEGLLAKVEGFQTELDNRDALAAITAAVEALLNEDGELVADQDAIDAAQDLLDAYEGDLETAELQDTINAAQALLNAEVLEAATEAVAALTTTNEDEEVVLAEGVTQAAIDAAQDLVDSYKGAAENVTGLQTAIEKAQDLLYAAEINAATTATELQSLLVERDVASYNNLTYSQRVEVAELFLVTLSAEEFTTTEEIENALELAVTGADNPATADVNEAGYLALLEAVNTAVKGKSITAVDAAIEDLNTEEYAALTAAQQLVAAENVIAKAPVGGYTTIAQIVANF